MTGFVNLPRRALYLMSGNILVSTGQEMRKEVYQTIPNMHLQQFYANIATFKVHAVNFHAVGVNKG